MRATKTIPSIGLRVLRFTILVSFISFVTTQLPTGKAWAFKPVDGAILIGGCGLGGGLLGLSTLSFHPQPEDHLNNVVIGAATGAIIGVALAMYFTITDTDSFEEYTGTPPPGPRPSFNNAPEAARAPKAPAAPAVPSGDEEEGYVPPQSKAPVRISHARHLLANSGMSAIALPKQTILTVPFITLRF